MKITEIEKLIEANRLEEALEILDSIQTDSSGTIKVHLLKSQIYQKKADWAGVINECNTILEIDPKNIEARSGVTMAQNILGFFNPDLFNP